MPDPIVIIIIYLASLLYLVMIIVFVLLYKQYMNERNYENAINQQVYNFAK